MKDPAIVCITRAGWSSSVDDDSANPSASPATALKGLQSLRPDIKVMPESVSLAVVETIIADLKPKVIAFSRGDWRDDIIQAARRAGAGIFVDRLGPDDTPPSWQDAIDRGATGIQTDRVAELIAYLRARGLHN